MSQRKDAARIFKALGDENRLRMLEIIAASDGVSASDIQEQMAFSQSTLSHHMKLLTDADVVAARRDGKFIRYSLSAGGFQTIDDFFADLAGVDDDE